MPKSQLAQLPKTQASVKSRRILVTGAAGFIGANFVDYWLARYPNDQIWGLDKLTYAGNLRNLSEAIKSVRFTFVKGDIADESLVRGLVIEHHIDTVINFAAESHVDRSIASADEFVQTNIVGTHNLLKVCKSIWIDDPNWCQRKPEVRFHQVSTDEVYGSLTIEDDSFTESSPFLPNSPYSASKAAADHMVRAFGKTYGLPVTTSHCSNNYGPYHHVEKMIPMIITHLLENETIGIYGDGLQIRDWLYVEDHIRGIEHILKDGIAGEHYNIGAQYELTNIELVHRICKLMEQEFVQRPELHAQYPMATALQTGTSTSLIEHVPDRLGHDKRYGVNFEKLAELGYQPQVDFDAGLKRTIAWFMR